mmetsp:Transcript_43452/g.117901  ORF Transcript_43452/g.117901 Transcript_43452/m.117901 type:complete len:256 (-) Transcript_43452:2490-3257(-)
MPSGLSFRFWQARPPPVRRATCLGKFASQAPLCLWSTRNPLDPSRARVLLPQLLHLYLVQLGELAHQRRVGGAGVRHEYGLAVHHRHGHSALDIGLDREAWYEHGSGGHGQRHERCGHELVTDLAQAPRHAGPAAQQLARRIVGRDRSDKGRRVGGTVGLGCFLSEAGALAEEGHEALCGAADRRRKRLGKEGHHREATDGLVHRARQHVSDGKPLERRTTNTAATGNLGGWSERRRDNQVAIFRVEVSLKYYLE